MPREQHYNTPEQVRDYLAEALAITRELEPPRALRGLVFDRASQLLAAKAILQDAVPVPLDLGALRMERGG
jgi:hypothetical protein